MLGVKGMWGWWRRRPGKEPEGQEAQEAQEAAKGRMPKARDEMWAAIAHLNATCHSEDPENWPGNFLVMLAHLDMSFLASFSQADAVIDAFGTALNLEYQRLAKASMEQIAMPSRRVH